jgi:hypothetical protein
MNELEKQVNKAHWRLGLARFLGVLRWCWSGALLVAVALIVVDKFYPLGVHAWSWPVGALGVGLIIASLWMVATRRGKLGAAIELDRRFGLKERVSSTLAMAPEERETEAGKALIADAVRRVGRIDVASRFFDMRTRLVPMLVPVLLCVVAAAAMLIPPMADTTAEAKPNPAESKERVVKSTETLREKLVQRRKQAQEQQLKDAEDLFKKLEQATRDMGKGETNREDALKAMNDLSRELQERRNQLGSDQIRKQLDQLKNIDNGPADKLAKAVREGDFKQAVEELQNIQKQLADGEISDEDKQKLANQLAQMEKKLKELAEAQAAQQEGLQKQIEQLRQAGDQAQADQLQQQLNQMLQQAPQMEQLNQMANKLGQCAKCLNNGQLGDAAGALQQLQANLQQQLNELEMLNQAMDDLRMARNQMNCQQCGGAGCPACQGRGMGMGAGSGLGPRPEADDDTDFWDSQVRQKIGEGTAVVEGLVQGPNIRGNVEEEVQLEFDAARRGETEPMTDRNIPRAYQKHVTEYMNSFREGE